MKKYCFLILCTIISVAAIGQTFKGVVMDKANSQPIPGVSVFIKGTRTGTTTASDGRFTIARPKGPFTLMVQFVGYQFVEKQFTAKDSTCVIFLSPSQQALQEVVVTGYGTVHKKSVTGAVANYGYAPTMDYENTNEFKGIRENGFLNTTKSPLSTFSADVDRASYSLVRTNLNGGQLLKPNAVRIEELINYFDYNYPAPVNTDPVAIYADLAICPWNKEHQLARIGLQGKKIPTDKLPPSNLVFLLDVSGSMSPPNRLPLVKQAFKALVQQLRDEDRVAIVVYAGAAGLVLPSTSGKEKTKIIDALENLSAGGSTAGGAGIKLAYRTAADHFIKKGNNRVILATDGDFNVGLSSEEDLQDLIEREREKGISLSVLGFGMGNYKDNRLETLADKGNGNYAYIDNFEEARRTFVTEFGGTLFTIAKDVKLQVEFNPKFVQSYRLVGYENRLLNDEDFNDDKKDAGDMGSGHTVTALYELVPVGAREGSVDPLKYQNPVPVTYKSSSNELLTVKMRYKEPDGEKSKLLEKVLLPGAKSIDNAPEDFRLAASVAQFGMLLRSSPYKGASTYESALKLANGARGTDPEGYRAEYIQLLKKAQLLQESVATR
ncbi:von Willebrand factor type A domain-containing protein [Chitinophaga niabensis]|uniref:vWA domain-containing protein n=1 Tax=Chitinophaga niabensis TaxID=536979 RepID=UPI0031BAF49C